MNRKLHFLCVGVQKAGTTTLHQILSQHPEVQLPEAKETHFFRDDEKYAKGLFYYYQRFFPKTAKPYTGEIDPEYAYFDYCAERIRTSLGTVRIVFLLRNPVERAYSHYLMTRRRGLETMDFMSAVSSEKQRISTFNGQVHYSYIRRGLYVEQFERFAETFGKDMVRAYLFEDFIKDTQAVISDIAEFLSLPAYDYNLDIISNPAADPRNTLIRDFIYKPGKLKKLGGKLIPSERARSRIMSFLNEMNLKKSTKEPLPDKDKSLLYHRYFKEEIAQLEKMLDRSLEIWKYE